MRRGVSRPRPGTRASTVPASLFAALLLVGGCATASGGTAAASAASGERPAAARAPDPRSGPDAAEAARLEALYWSQVESARNRFTEADVGFMVGMIGHHAQALLMAGLVPDRSRDRSIRTLALRIDSAQRSEILLMEQWLRSRDQPVPHWHIEGSTLVFEARSHGEHAPAATGHAGHAGHGAPPRAPADDAHADHGGMPGMLSDAQLAELEAASGPAFDRLFLAFMIQHHEGALEMVRTLFATDGAGQDTEVFRFASDVQVDQASEIARMERMLRDRAPALP